MTLYTLSYEDLRTKDFHNSIYFGKGRVGLSNFYVDYDFEDTYCKKYFQTDKYSTVTIGSSYAYLRQNGNYMIQIEGFPNKALHNDNKELYVTDYFIKDWYATGVFIIEDSNGKAYNTIFKH